MGDPSLSPFYSGIFLFQASAQTYHLSPSGVQQVNEGENFVFDCTVESGMRPLFVALLDSSTLTSRISAEDIQGGSHFTFGPVNANDDGGVLQCSAANVFTVQSATLFVTREYCYCLWSSVTRTHVHIFTSIRLVE